MWDSIFADPERFFFAQCIGTAMVQRIQPALLEGDFVQDIQLLQNYEMPPVEEILELADKVRREELQRRDDSFVRRVCGWWVEGSYLSDQQDAA